MDKDTKKILKALEEQGFEVRTTSKGHLQIRKNGQVIAVLSGTASDHRSMPNALARLRRAGFQWRK